MNCVFCQIVKKERPAKVYFEDEDLIVFKDILPRAQVHLLVCPKVHYANLMDLPDDLLLKTFNCIKRMAREMMVEDNFRLVLNNGAQSGQIVGHLHFHFQTNASHVNLVFKS